VSTCIRLYDSILLVYGSIQLDRQNVTFRASLGPATCLNHDDKLIISNNLRRIRASVEILGASRAFYKGSKQQEEALQKR
jgi:hypothetical protein